MWQDAASGSLSSGLPVSDALSLIQTTAIIAQVAASRISFFI